MLKYKTSGPDKVYIIVRSDYKKMLGPGGVWLEQDPVFCEVINPNRIQGSPKVIYPTPQTKAPNQNFHHLTFQNIQISLIMDVIKKISQIVHLDFKFSYNDLCDVIYKIRVCLTASQTRLDEIKSDQIVLQKQSYQMISDNCQSLIISWFELTLEYH